MRKTLLYIGGGITMFFALFHFMFYKLFSWATELPKLHPSNEGVVLMLTVASLYMLLFGGFISFYLARKKESFTFIERAMLYFIAGYYVLRIVFAVPFFGFNIGQIVISLFCLLTALCYLIPLKQK